MSRPMGGTICDPIAGQMLAPDNYVSLPHRLSGYNRYLYANGNPLKYTDPSGNKLKWGQELFFVLVNSDPFSSMAGLANMRAHQKWGDDLSVHSAFDLYSVTNFLLNSIILMGGMKLTILPT